MKKIERVNVADKVFEQMKQMIVTGEWKVGQKLPGENELVKEFGVSRVSVRDAIHRLIGMGVLTARHGDGTYVTDPVGGQLSSRLMQKLLLSTPKLLEVLQFRSMVEVGSAGLAAKMATEEDIALLRDLEQKMKDSGDDVAEFARLDLAYHNAIAIISGNSLMAQVMAVVQGVYASAMEETILLRGMEVGRKNHPSITDAIEAHDAALSEERMREHIQAVMDLLPQQ